ncbi:hypothetical protein [Nostoc sp.]
MLNYAPQFQFLRETKGRSHSGAMPPEDCTQNSLREAHEQPTKSQKP